MPLKNKTRPDAALTGGDGSGYCFCYRLFW